MNIEAFEIALVKKLSKELDIPENWKNNSSGLSSIQHISKNYVLFLSNYNGTVSLIAPKMYNFVDEKLTQNLYKQAIKIFEENNRIAKKECDEKTRKSLIEDFGLESRASKLRALENRALENISDQSIQKEKNIKNIELKLPKKSFWKKWF